MKILSMTALIMLSVQAASASPRVIRVSPGDRSFRASVEFSAQPDPELVGVVVSIPRDQLDLDNKPTAGADLVVTEANRITLTARLGSYPPDARAFRYSFTIPRSTLTKTSIRFETDFTGQLVYRIDLRDFSPVQATPKQPTERDAAPNP